MRDRGRRTGIAGSGRRPAKSGTAVAVRILIAIAITSAAATDLATAGPVPAEQHEPRFDLVGLCNVIEAPLCALEDQVLVEVPLRILPPAGQARGTVRVDDIFGRPVASDQPLVSEGAGSRASGLTLKLPVGSYRIRGECEIDGRKVTPTMDVAIVPQHRPGLRPDSFFASTVSSLRTGDELRLLQRLGIKVQRASFMPRLVGEVPEVPTGAPLEVDFDPLDRALKESQAAGVWVLPVVGPSFPGTVRPAVPVTGMLGPPRDFDEFTRTWETVVRHRSELITWDFWENARVFGPTWAAPAEEYRRLQTKWLAAALKANPKVRLIAGASAAFVEDQIEAHPTSWVNLLAGISHEPAVGADAGPMRDGALARSIDHGAIVTRRMGLRYCYLTGGGPIGRSAGGEGGSAGDNIHACKTVQYAVRAALCGAFQADVPWGTGCGPGRTRSNSALALLANMIEDRPIVADIWPENELIFGAVFAHPRHVTDAVRKLPRAAELAARWEAPVPDDRADDAVKVAVVWSHTGKSVGEPDTGGTLTLEDARGLRAYDLVGRGIPAAGGRLTVPLGEYPVYITTDTLDVVGLRDRVAAARIEHVTPVSLYALSLTRPAHELQQLCVRVENQLNREVKGTLALEAGEGGQATEAPLAIPAAKLAEVVVPWPGAKASPQNEYAVTLTARTDAGDVARRQIIAVAAFIQRSIRVDGDLADWAGATPVRLDSDRLSPAGAKRIVGRIYTAYDDFNAYLAAEVHENEFVSPAGKPAVVASPVDGRAAPLPYKNAMPDGLGHIRLAGDALVFAFGFRDRVPGWGRQMADPYAWKGHFYDTDFQYAAHASTEGDRLVRLWGPDTTRRGAYQGEKVAGYGPVSGAKVVIRRDENAKVTIYEMSIPRLELYLFDPNQGRCRFGFVLANNERLGRQGGLEWSEAAGVFDHWRSFGSFAPSSAAHLACQTFFGIERIPP